MTMKLVVATPVAVVIEQDGVRYVRAEDRTGAFGIERGHADFLTVLAVSVLIWRDAQANEHYLAVRGGVLRVRSGNLVEVATREAVPGTDLGRLRAEVLAEMTRNVEAERSARRGALNLERAAIRQLSHYLRPGARAPVPRVRASESLQS
jgi:F-type H+-transporting ATPase subunit epsilon